MLSQKMQDAFNAQIHAEYYSSYLYLAMSSWCEQSTFKGFARWLRIQADEERKHAFKLIDYVHERGGKVQLQALEAPPADFGTVVSLFDKVLEHELHITGRIHKLFELARAEKDLASELFLGWFVSEQVEEEATAGEIVEKLRMVGDRAGSVLYLDKEYGKRQG
ncbi:MAG TPA: ferritin [Polyangiaceae bacterium]|nr:ferritin [Polyangiaceae bacterium]